MRNDSRRLLAVAGGLALSLLVANCGTTSPGGGGGATPAPSASPAVPVPSSVSDPVLSNRHADPNGSLTSQNLAQLQQAWYFRTDSNVTQSPLVEDGNVYLADWDGNVYALGLADGSEHWRTHAADPKAEWPWHGFAGSGALGAGTLYEASVEGKLYALDPRTGAIRWQTPISDDPQAGSLAKLLYHDGLVYVGLQSVAEPLSKERPESAINFRGSVAAFDAKTGQEVWRRSLADAPHDGVAVWSSFALDPGMNALFVTTGNNYTGDASRYSDSILALNAKTGDIYWSKQFNDHDVWLPIKRLGPDYDFPAGAQLFEATIDGQNRKLVGAGQKSGAFWALDRRTGELVWWDQISNGGTLGGMHAEASIGTDRVLAWGNDSYALEATPSEHPMTIKALDINTGKPLWVVSGAQPASLTTAGVLSSDVYLVPSLDGKIRGYRASDGRKVWTSGGYTSIGSSLVLSGDTLLYGTGVPDKFGGQGTATGLYALRIGQ